VAEIARMEQVISDLNNEYAVVNENLAELNMSKIRALTTNVKRIEKTHKVNLTLTLTLALTLTPNP
jgi:hypothetical protein